MVTNCMLKKGVLWHGNELLPGIKETLELLKVHGKQLIFVSNNSTKSREGYLAKFKKLGIDANKEQVISSSYASAYYIKHCAKFPADKRIYVIGEKGICQELDDVGLKWFGGSSFDAEYIESDEDRDTIQPDEGVGAVLIGFDSRFNYRKLSRAHCFIRYNQQCEFYATNDDVTLPTQSRLFPGTGTMVAALAAAVDRKPKVLGKPHEPMMEAIMKEFHLNKTRTCMVGDRLNTDIQFGLNGGLQTLLVLTGVTTRECLKRLDDGKPHFFVQSLSELRSAF